jgi:ribosomal-protein-alanine N-acetyltransferase
VSIIIRKALPEDAAAVYEIESEISRHPWNEDQIREEIEFVQAYTCVCEEDSRIVGFAIIQNAAEFAHINEFGVLASHRRRGIGRMLMEDIIRESLERGCEFISLEVRESNDPAQALYRSFGFRQEGLRKGFYRDPQEDGLVLVKKLKEETD